MRRAQLRTLAWVAGLTVTIGVGTWLLLPEGSTARDVRRSAFRTTPDGVAGLARTLERLGRPTITRTAPLIDGSQLPGTLVVLAPVLTPTPAEVHAILDRVRGGGTLLYAPPLAETVYGQLTVTPLMDSLEVEFLTPQPGDRGQPRWVSHPLTEGLADPPTPRRVVQVARSGSDELLVTGRSGGRRMVAATQIALGEGRILLLSDAEPVSNEHAADHPVAVLAVRALLARTAPGDSIVFDEFHQGVRGSQSTAARWTGFFLGSPGGRALFGVLLVAFLALACSGLRFGAPMAPVAPPDVARRSLIEHVDALGDLYEKAGAHRTAALLLLARLARSVRRPPPRSFDDAEALVREVEARRGEEPALDRIRRGLRAQPVDLTMIAAGIDDHTTTRSHA